MRILTAVFAVALVLSPAGARAADRVLLDDGWRFRTDPDGAGEKRGWASAVPADTQPVRVPHTWNLGPRGDHEGVGWYWRTLRPSADLKGRRVELHFGATFYRSRIFVNGKAVGAHEGGHTAHFVDLTPHLGAPEVLVAVEVDNRPAWDTLPGWAMNLKGWYDWWHYGGLVRQVWLRVSAPVAVRRQEIRPRLEGDTARVSTRILVDNFGASATSMKLEAAVFAPGASQPVATVARQVEARPGQQATVVELRLQRPELWHFDRPKLYRLRVRLLDRAGALADEAEDSFGVRSVEIKNRRLYVNGERVRLSGMTRHADSPWEGLAETAGTIRRDYDDLKALQVTLTRPVHYPQDPLVLEYADENGILLIPEIPMWQFNAEQMADPKVRTLAKQMLREMIEQAYNHPSIFAWSVGNESATDEPAGREYVKEMRAFVKSLDPDRFVTFADNRLSFGRDPRKNAAADVDFVMLNEYFGTWNGPDEGLVPMLEKVGRAYPDKMVIISEFGAAAFFGGDRAGGDRVRQRVMRQQLEIFGRYDWIAGAIFWCYQDYRSHRNLWAGDKDGWVDMGIVDEDRQRKPSHALWKQLNSPVRITLGWTFAGKRPSGFTASIGRRRPEELPAHDLRGYSLEWEVRDGDGTVRRREGRDLPLIGPPFSFTGQVGDERANALTVRVRVRRPTGFIAGEETLTWTAAPRQGELPVSEAEMKKRTVP